MNATNPGPASDGPLLPLVIISGSGNVADLAVMNAKSYRKSIEQGYLWTVDETTGRVLPYREKTFFTEIRQSGRWYTAVVPDTAPREGVIPPDSSPIRQPDPQNPGPGSPGILSELAAVIRKRRAELPEGSYTSYLFRQGPDKIRKKTGEEAVELILARNPEETVSEAADLLYHMLVLLEALDIDVDGVFSELKKRHG